uniref:Uncharacterized protein LOC113791461 n=1 Tax=Dermatophagoides pteronyssinus TaxID=6956 RepID=A0A6P6XUF0_DERPT|nr:uncharacterized protein LOC113791461 [Dermatophagoides pteronyssinus]
MDNENLSVICREITMRIHNKILSRSLSCKDEDRVRILAAQMVEIEEKRNDVSDEKVKLSCKNWSIGVLLHRFSVK